MFEYLEIVRLYFLGKFIHLFWWCDRVLTFLPSRRTQKNIFFTGLEPWVISLIISGIAFGANLGVQLLLKPKIKTPPRPKLSGELSLTDSAWGLPLFRIHGQRAADGIGGIEVGTNIIFCSDIRKIQVPVAGTSSTSRGKGGGGNKNTDAQTEEHLVCDMGAAIGQGRLRLLRLKLNEDVVFDQSNAVLAEPSGTKFEAEAGTKTGTASNTSVPGFSGGSGVTNLNSTGTLNFALSGTAEDYVLHIGYKSSADVTCEIEFGGETLVYSFPATGNFRGWRTIVKRLAAGTNNFKLKNASSANLKIDCLIAEAPQLITSPDDLYYRPTGLYDNNLSTPAEADNLIFPVNDYRSLENINRFNLPVYEESTVSGIGSTDGVIMTTLSNGASMAFYPGSEDQPIDAVYAAWVATQPGKTSAHAQAFLGTSWVRLQDLDFTKWGSFPNVRALVENMDTGTVEEILLAEAALIPGLSPADFNLSAASGMVCRGYVVNNNDAPEKAFNELGTIFNLGFAETVDGKLTAFDKNVRTSVATVTKDELGAYLKDEQQTPPADDVLSTVQDEVEMPQTLELSFINPLPPTNFGTDRREHPFPFTNSVKKDTVSVNVCLLPDESQRIVKRLNQERWLKASPEQFTLPPKYAWVNAGEVLTVPVGGENKLLRIEKKEGSVPGIFELVATNDELYVSADGGTITITRPNESVNIPSPTLGTLMELPPLFNEQLPGLYAVPCPIGPGKWTGASLSRLKGASYQTLCKFTKKGNLGRCASALANPPGGYNPGDLDTTSTLSVDFYDDFTPETVTAPEQADGANLYVVGNELVYVRTWTRDNAYPNRWDGTNLIREGKFTDGTGHQTGERCVYFTDAVKFVPIEPEERGIERTWKFATVGESLNAVAPILFTWTGGTAPPPPLSVAFDPENEILNDLSIVHSIYGLVTFNQSAYQQSGRIYWKKPGGAYELLTEITPDNNLQAEFRAVNLSLGTHYFKVVVVSASGVEQAVTPTEYTVDVSAENFVINGKQIENVADRVFVGFDNLGKYTGRDTGKVPTARITPAIAKNTELAGDFVDVKIVGTISGYETDQAANADSVTSSRVRVYDNYGNLIATLTKTFRGTGDLGEGVVGTAVAAADLYFKVDILNYYGWSDPVYLLSDNSFSTTEPTPDTPPSNLPPIITSITYDPATQQVTVNYTPRGGSGTFKLQSATSESGTYSDVSGQTAISAGATSTSFVISQTSLTQHLWFKIKRNDVTGYSDALDIVIPAIDPAQSPINLYVEQVTPGDPFEISWTDRGAAGNNILEEGPSAGGPWTLIDSAASNPTFATPPTGGSWWYRISNDAVPGQYSVSNRGRWFY